MKIENITRGQVYYADLSPVVGSEQGGLRPVVIVSNNVGNKYSPVVIACPLTSRVKHSLPTHVDLPPHLFNSSIIEAEQIRTIDKKRLKRLCGELPQDQMTKLNRALAVSIGLKEV